MPRRYLPSSRFYRRPPKGLPAVNREYEVNTLEMYETPRALNDYLDRRFACACGREHYAPLKTVRIGKDALLELPQVIREQGFQSVYLVSDPMTYQIAGERCMEILKGAGIRAQIRQLTHTDFDEATLGELLIHMPADCDLVIAVGTGAINDMTRYFSFRTGRPFFTVATAAPMDGFASSIAALNVDSMKTTFPAQTPLAIFGDTEILKNAPYRMIAAGLGDLLGKFTCLCDWKLARIITGEHYCPRIVELVENCVQGVLGRADQAKDRDPEVLGGIMEGLVLTGVAMSLYGNSRPASGCEHHISHYWEMMFEQRRQRPVPHGIQVGIGTVLILRLTEALRRLPSVDFDAARAAARAYDPAAWEREIRTAYGPAAGGVIELEEQSHKNDPAERLRRLDVMEARWGEIQALLEALPASQTVEGLLRSLEAPCYPAQIGVDRAMLRDTLLYCKEVRARYTILQMLWDLDLLAPLAGQVMEELPDGV